MANPITLLVVAALVPVVLVCSYYYLLLLVALAGGRSQRTPTKRKPDTRFLILIPAHDEEKTIADTLASCQGLDYPPDLFQILVVADNCTDSTAEIATITGARCLERTNSEKRGKGYALAWAFRQILTENHHAIIVLDADCQIDRQALTAFDIRISAGQKILQASDVTSNPDESSISYTMAVGNLIENRLFYAPKSILGLVVFLRGTGMVLSTEVLRHIQWDAYGLAEDVEYTVRLLDAGIPVRFAPEVTVHSAFPIDGKQLSVQRSRWAQGNLGLMRTLAPRWIVLGIIGRRFQLVDAGLTLLAISRPLVGCAAVGAVGVACLAHLLNPSFATRFLLTVGIGCLLGLGVYWGVGVVLLGLTARRLRFLAAAPVVFGRLTGATFRGLLGMRVLQWTKTPRR